MATNEGKSKYFSAKSKGVLGDKSEKIPRNTKKIEEPRAKRTNSEVSNSSISDELTVIMEDLQEIKSTLDETTKKKDLTEVKNIMSEMIKEVKTEMQARIQEIEERNKKEHQKMQKEIDGLLRENNTLKEKLMSTNKTLREVTQMSNDAIEIAKDAQRKSNYNEQYSRKNNFLIHGVTESPREDTTEVALSSLEDAAQVKLQDSEIVAIHRIPGKKDMPRPIHVKVKNSSVKAKVMRKRSHVKKNGKGLCLKDDVTKLNTALIQRLNNHSSIQQGWYFNGSVYACPMGGTRRLKFDIHDDIDDKLKKTRDRNIDD
ncbi:hypothetical protein FSP39_021395 [Pinctada imbricata]|uniref:Uncharacterized protein n=1 Tax=Pinctada imbricata TaxID=66713 RepID=A0AA88XGF3_PINIB|nr:hypothetical protein FSP39_021395 [Pinctada imbricata]